MKPVPLQPNLPTPTTAFGNPAPIAQYYICPHCNKQSPLIKEWVGLTEGQIAETLGFGEHTTATTRDILTRAARAIEAKLKEKNNG